MKFNENLKYYRQLLGCTQREMANILGLSERGYRNYELGRNEPNISDLIRIADLFRISLDDLVGRDFSKDSLMDHK